MPDSITVGILAAIIGAILGNYYSAEWPTLLTLGLMAFNFALRAIEAIKIGRARNKTDHQRVWQAIIAILAMGLGIYIDTNIMPRGHLLTLLVVFFILSQEIIKLLTLLESFISYPRWLSDLLQRLQK